MGLQPTGCQESLPDLEVDTAALLGAAISPSSTSCDLGCIAAPCVGAETSAQAFAAVAAANLYACINPVLAQMYDCFHTRLTIQDLQKVLSSAESACTRKAPCVSHSSVRALWLA